MARRWSQRLAVALVSTALLFAVLEGVVRVAGFSHPPADLPIAIWDPFFDSQMASPDWMFRSSVRQLWDHRPGAPVFQWAEERLNAAGFRGPLVPVARTPGVLRVATLGDSSCFGVGVRFEDGTSAQLERLLDEQGTPSEVLCFGVVGHTARTGLERYREVVRAYRPDVVIAGYGAINESFASVVSDEQKIARNERRNRWHARVWRTWRERSRALHLVAWVADRVTDAEGRRRAWFAEEVRRQTAGSSEVGSLAFAGVRRVSPDEFEAALTTLVREIRADGAAPILMSMPRRVERETPVLGEYTRLVEAVAARESVPLLDAHSLFRQPPDGASSDVLFLAGDPVHPSPEGHRRIAAALLPLVQEAARAPAEQD